MPYSSNSGGGGPWGGGNKGSGGQGGGGKSPWGGGNKGGGQGGGGGNQGGGGGGPDLEDIIRQGRDKLRVVLGGGGNKKGNGGSGGGGGVERYLPYAIPILLVVVWLYQSFYRVQEQDRAVELIFGEFYAVKGPGLNFAPWPVITHEPVQFTTNRVVDIGLGRTARDRGLMLTGDENIVDIGFQVVWNVSDARSFLFQIAEPEETIRAVAESAMREVIGRSELQPILNRDRGLIVDEVQVIVQQTLDEYRSGIRIVRINLNQVDPPAKVVDSFRDVQAAEQERDRLEKEGEATRNRVLAEARGEVRRIEERALGEAVTIVNQAVGETERFLSVYEQYKTAPSVTIKRLYLDTIGRALAEVDKVIIDENAAGSGAGGGSGIVPYLPLDQLRRGADARGASQ